MFGNETDTYKDWDYVTKELEKLVEQATQEVNYIIEINLDEFIAKKFLYY